MLEAHGRWYLVFNYRRVVGDYSEDREGREILGAITKEEAIIEAKERWPKVQRDFSQPPAVIYAADAKKPRIRIMYEYEL